MKLSDFHRATEIDQELKRLVDLDAFLGEKGDAIDTIIFMSGFYKDDDNDFSLQLSNTTKIFTQETKDILLSKIRRAVTDTIAELDDEFERL